MKKIISSVCALSIAMLISFNCFAVPASAVSPVAVADAPNIFFTALKSLGYTFSYSSAVSSAASTTASASGYNSYLFNKIIEGAIANGFITGASSASAVGTTIAGGASVTLGGVVLTAGAAAAIVAAAFYIDSQMAEPSTDIFKMPDGSVVKVNNQDLFVFSTSRFTFQGNTANNVISGPFSSPSEKVFFYPKGTSFSVGGYSFEFNILGTRYRFHFTSRNNSTYNGVNCILEYFNTSSQAFVSRCYFYFPLSSYSSTLQNRFYCDIVNDSFTLTDDFYCSIFGIRGITSSGGSSYQSLGICLDFYNNFNYIDNGSSYTDVSRASSIYSPDKILQSSSYGPVYFINYRNSTLQLSTVISENSDIVENFASTSSASSRLEALDTAIENASADTDTVATIPNITTEDMQTLPLDLVQNTADIDAMVIDGYSEPAEGSDYAPVDDTWSDAVDTPVAGYDEIPPDYPSSDPSATNLLPGNTFAGPWHYVTEVFAYIEEFVVAFLLFFNNALPYSVTALIWACFVLLMLFGLLNRLLK